MLIALVTALDEALMSMPQELAVRKETVHSAVKEALYEASTNSLQFVPVEELRQPKAGIRVQALADAGYRNLKDLAMAEDAALTAVNGIGEKQVAAIRSVIAAFRSQIAGQVKIRLFEELNLVSGCDAKLHRRVTEFASGNSKQAYKTAFWEEDESERNRQMILALAVWRISRQICADAAPVQAEFHRLSQDILPGIRIRSSFRWLFSGRRTKDSTLEAIERLTQFSSSRVYERAARLQGRFRDLESLTIEEARKDFEQHSAEYCILLEKFSEFAPAADETAGSLPADLAASIDRFPVNTEYFSGSLRPYQLFGVKYVLHQKRVLLGDDMGLGKTIQAIAAMAHLYSENTKAHFLVICPAGVLINWCREIRRFSRVPARLLHGKGLEAELERWRSEGGAAVTNYETINRIIDQINDRVSIPLLIVDEAHYIKNPKALRTRHVRMLEDEAEGILLMTGTSLENQVMEMCSLIDFIRPDLAMKVRESAALSRTQEFREMIAPVYLRRRRQDVLGELPEVEEKKEWCGMTGRDQAAYAEESSVAREAEELPDAEWIREFMAREHRKYLPAVIPAGETPASQGDE